MSSLSLSQSLKGRANGLSWLEVLWFRRFSSMVSPLIDFALIQPARFDPPRSNPCIPILDAQAWIGLESKIRCYFTDSALRLTFPFILHFARSLRFFPTSLQDSRILAVAYTSLSSSSGRTPFVRSTIYRFVPIKGKRPSLLSFFLSSHSP